MKLLIVVVIFNYLHYSSAQLNPTNLVLPKNFNPYNVSNFPGFDALRFDSKYYNPFSYDIANIFQRFEKRYNRSYSSSEILKRRQYLINTLLSLSRHILFAFVNGSTFKVSLNKFSDWSPQELRRLSGTITRKQSTRAFIPEQRCLKTSRVSLPYELDYRKTNEVTPVRDQMSCTACWAFGTVAAIESRWAVIHKQLINLSEQVLINCLPHNCSKGWSVPQAFQYVIKNGIEREANVPYINNTGVCRHSPMKDRVRISSYCALYNRSDAIIQRNIYDFGPVAVYVNADHVQNYASGVLDVPKCSKSTDHTVLIVDWGTELGVKYWIVKNSWTADWGEEGYFRIVRGKDMCGINEALFYREFFVTLPGHREVLALCFLRKAYVTYKFLR